MMSELLTGEEEKKKDLLDEKKSSKRAKGDRLCFLSHSSLEVV